MSTSDVIALGALVMAIIVPLGSLMIFYNESARRSRVSLYTKVAHIETCLHRLHDDGIGRISALGERVARLEALKGIP